MKVATWNLNGLRARAGQLLEFIPLEKPDVICLQEIRVTPQQIPMDVVELPGYHCHWHGGPKGYSGVALHLADHFPKPTWLHPDFDYESRILGAQVGDTVFYSVYVPNGGKDFAAKMTFLEQLERHLGELAQQGKTVILSGDLNIARGDLDVHPKERKPKAVGQLHPERELLERLFGLGYTDVMRSLYPDRDDLFTWWAPWRELRQRNIGWRIDYVVASNHLSPTECVSLREFGTSDHAPVVATFSDSFQP